MPGEPEKRLDDIVTPRFLESLASEQDRNLKAAIIRASRTARRRPKGTVGEYITLDMGATNAASHGLFASNENRRIVWQLAYRLYFQICESGIFVPKQMADQHSVWKPDNCEDHLAQSRKNFVLLRQLMTGDFNVEQYDSITLSLCVGSTWYFELPPKPEGEPGIPFPPMEVSFNFADDTTSQDDDMESDDDDDEYDEVDEDDETSASSAQGEQLTLF